MLSNQIIRTLAGPCLYWSAAIAYAWASGLEVAPRAAAFGAYLFVPALLILVSHPAAWMAAAVTFWLPIEFHLLPALPFPSSGGYDASALVGVVTAFYLFLIARPLDGIGYTFKLGARDFALAAAAIVVYAAIAIPVGFATGFLTWNPRPGTDSVLVTPIVIYLVTAIPEELLFRGLLQNLFTRWLGSTLAVAAASVIFGLAHFPDPRYMALAAVAGVAYGLVYAKTRKITASALTHMGVDWIWVSLFRQ